MVEKIKEISGRTDAEIKNQFLSSKKAREKLGWEPEYDLDKGMKETYD